MKKSAIIWASAGAICGSLIGAAAMYFAMKRKIQKKIEELEKDYQDLQSSLAQKEEDIRVEREVLETQQRVVDEERNSMREKFKRQADLIIKSHEYATKEENIMEQPDGEVGNLNYESVEDSIQISLKDYESMNDPLIEKFTWYYDHVTGDVTDEHGAQVEYYFGTVLEDILDELEEGGEILGTGDDFCIENRSHFFVAMIVIERW